MNSHQSSYDIWVELSNAVDGLVDLKSEEVAAEVEEICSLSGKYLAASEREVMRCNFPLGSSEALSVRCARPAGHDGEHRSVFERPAQEPESDTWIDTDTAALREGER